MPKSPAQLNREIAEVLSRRKAPANDQGVRRAHSTVKSNGSKKQEKILLTANEAALIGEFKRAEEILGQGEQRAIATAYSTITPESAEEGDVADRGWMDEDGDSIEITDYEIEAQHEVGSKTPVTDAIVETAVRWLRDHGAAEASSTAHHAGVWYSSPFEVEDYRTGEEQSKDFFLRNFTPQEEKLVFDSFKRGRRR